MIAVISTETVVASALQIPAIIAGVGWLIRRTVAEIDRRQTDAERRIEQLERGTVNKEEWIRSAALERINQEQILQEIGNLKGQLALGEHLGRALTAAIEKR